MLMHGKELTAEQRVQKAVISIMAHPDYYAVAPVMMLGTKVVDDKTPTACTNGRDEKYGRKFVDGLNDAELRFLILHETYHKMYRHLTTWRHLYKQDADRANRACDYVINIKLVDQDSKRGFITMPKSGLLDTKYRGMDSAQVYNLLPESDEGGDGGDGGMDDHDWDGAQEMTDEEEQQLAREIDEAVRQGASTTCCRCRLTGVRCCVSLSHRCAQVAITRHGADPTAATYHQAITYHRA
jgi:predicted metal-dependent peptidase